MSRNIIALVVIAAIAVLLAFSALPSWGHEFYSAACCSDKDCGPAVLGDVTWTPAGYHVRHTNEIVPLNDPRIQYSPPGEPGYRLCQVPFTKTIRCLYVPSPEG